MSTELKEYVKKVGKKESVCTMEHAGFKASLMRASRLKGEGIHGLPPEEKIRVFPIASLPGSPDGWVREAGTYVVPVDTEWGLWFDWTMNDALNHAIIPSTKGMNPITGRKLEGFGLEEYSDKCPTHGCDLTHGNLCNECGYELPPQNYVCNPNTLWWDGFRQSDGSVRQFFFTDEDERDIASAVIGKENTVPAFGFACYKPKNPRTTPSFITRGGPMMFKSMAVMDSCEVPLGSFNDDFSMDNSSIDVCYKNQPTTTCYNAQLGVSGNTGPMGAGVSGSSGKQGGTIRASAMIGERRKRSYSHKKNISKSIKKSKSVSVGAGARINQVLVRDDLGLDG